MGIRAVSGISALSYNSQSSDSSSQKKAQESSSEFSRILESVTGVEKPESGKVENTVTVTRVLSDGSLVIRKMKGESVIEEMKLSGAAIQQQNLQATANPYTQAYMAGSGVSTGALFSAAV